MKRIPMPVTSGYDTTTNTYDVHAKANVLMQTYLNQHHQGFTSFTSTASTVDRAKCLSVGVQLCKALVDVAAQSNQQNNGVGSLTTTLVCCELSQLLVQGMLPNDSLLYQIPHFTTAIVEQCHQQTVTDDEGNTSPVDSVLDILDMVRVPPTCATDVCPVYRTQIG